MILLISRRKVLKKLNQIRWSVPKQRIEPPYVTRGEDYSRWDRGLKKDHFESYLAIEDYQRTRLVRFFVSICIKLRPKYSVLYTHKLKDILEESVKDGYILEGAEQRLILTSKGKEVIAWFYFVKIFFGNFWVKTVGTGLIVSSLIAYGGWRLDKAFPKEPIKIEIEYPQPQISHTINYKY